MSKETSLFDKMIKHYVKSVSTEATPAEREEHRSIYEATKHQLWELHERDESNAKLG
jgi:hypothetical protein